jgi:hypothetical protein
LLVPDAGLAPERAFFRIGLLAARAIGGSLKDGIKGSPRLL